MEVAAVIGAEDEDKGGRMRPCVEPVKVTRLSERILLTSVIWDLLVRNSHDPLDQLVDEMKVGDQFLC